MSDQNLGTVIDLCFDLAVQQCEWAEGYRPDSASDWDLPSSDEFRRMIRERLELRDLLEVSLNALRGPSEDKAVAWQLLQYDGKPMPLFFGTESEANAYLSTANAGVEAGKQWNIWPLFARPQGNTDNVALLAENKRLAVDKAIAQGLLDGCEQELDLTNRERMELRDENRRLTEQVAVLHSRLASGEKAKDAWCSLALHQFWCRTCAEDSVGSCEEGREWHELAEAAEAELNAAKGLPHPSDTGEP